MAVAPKDSPGGTPMIARFSSLKGLGVFLDHSHTAPELRQYNLIYGFNGSGKTTLSRVLASLGLGALRPKLPVGGTFEIELAGGTRVKSAGGLETLKDRLLVFNVDFVEDNIKWTDGTASPVFYIGEKQAGLAEKLEKLEKDIESVAAAQEVSRQKAVKAEKSFTDFKAVTAKTIAENTAVKSYTAATLAGEYAKKTYGAGDEVPTEEVQPLQGVIAQAAPMAKLTPIDASALGLSQLVEKCRRLLETTLGELAIRELRDHAPMVRWVKEGVEYHGAKKLEDCLFCGGQLTKERMDALGAALDNRLDRLNQELAQTKASAVALRDRIAALATLRSKNDVSPDLQAEFVALGETLTGKLGEARTAVTGIIELLERKLAAPNTKIDAGQLIAEAQAQALETATIDARARINAVFTRHNTGVDKFVDGKEAARVRVRGHYLARNQNSYKKLETEATQAKTAVAEAAQKQAELAKEAEALRQGVREHGPAAGRINELLHSYLGHKELDIKTLTAGYQIQRNGKPVTASLSEGEKTAVALCYFLSTLEAEGRDKKKMIVVVDDPISSLDTRALHHAFGLIKSSLGEAGQLIVMTHNIHFMHSVKRWLVGRYRSKTPTAMFLFLDTTQDPATKVRTATLTELPKYIRDYESEYQYLFHLLLKFVAGTDPGHEYLIPNALRKLMDIFLAFKLPNSSGLGDKVEQVTREYSLDPARMNALDRLVQIESHADNLDDVVAFSSMTLEESKRAAEVLVEMMKKVDGRHYELMADLCKG